MRKTLLIALAAAIPLLAVAGYAAAGGQSELADVRDATAAFHDLDVVEGKRKELSGKIQERYGIAKDEAEKQIDDWLTRVN